MTAVTGVQSQEAMDQSTSSPVEVKKANSRKTPEHPTYAEMVTSAIKALDEKTGSSRQAIVKYITANYSVDEGKVNNQIRNAIKRFTKSGLLKQSKGTGASGSFKISEDFQAKSSAKPAAKKPKSPKKAKAPKAQQRSKKTPKEKKQKSVKVSTPKPKKQSKK